MTPEEHKQRHIELHKKLDELAADFLIHTKKRLGNSTILELIEWSHEQTLNPTEIDHLKT